MNETMYEPEPRVLAVLVTHNGGPWLARSLESIAGQYYRALDLVVVDNGSRQEAAPAVARLAPGAELVRSERNLGFGAAANAGLESSSRTGGADFFLFLHDDVYLDPDAVHMLVQAALTTNAGVVGGKGLDWERPEVLVEVGMSADQLCSPFSGLEEGEIDQGQHENLTETLFVSNACMLVSRRLAERCGLWDGAYFAFGEDLDLCLRARLSGFTVVVEPRARFHHALALVSGQRTLSRRVPTRTRLAKRNQLRTIAKNSSRPRMVLGLALCGILTLVRIAGLLVLKRTDEIPDYTRAYLDFARSFRGVMARRRAVQRRRTVPDREVRVWMIRDTQRLRLLFERRARDVEKATMSLSRRTMRNLSFGSLKESFGMWIRQPMTLATILIVVLGLVAVRPVLFGGPLASGTLWPYPEATGRFLGDYLSGWRNVALGTESAAPPAYPILWFVSLLGLGAARIAQKLTILLLLTLGLVGINRCMKRAAAPCPARVVALGVYALSPAAAALVTAADLPAMALYAGLPYALARMLALMGSGTAVGDVAAIRTVVPPRVDALITAAGRLALVLVPVLALAPSSLPAVVLFLLVPGLALTAAGGFSPAGLRRLRLLLVAPPLALAVLIPWTFEGLRPSGPILAPLFSGLTGWYFPLWNDYSFEEMLLLNPGTRLGGLVVLGVLVGALALADPVRRAETRALAAGVIAFGLLGGLSAKGLLPPLVASPTMWLAFPLVLTAVAAGHLVAGLGQELPRHSFGWRQRVAIPLLGVALAAGVLGGWAPQLVRWSRPPGSLAGGSGEVASSIGSFLQATAQEVGDFRVLWLGRRWTDPIRQGVRPTEGIEYFLTTAQGLTALEGVAPPPAQGEARLQEVVNAMMDRRLHLAGHLLAPASVQFIVADPADEATIQALGRQRDIALEQQQEGVAVFRNLQWLPRATYAPTPLSAEVVTDANTSSLMLVDWIGGRAIPARSPSRFSDEMARSAHSLVLLGDNFNGSWRASLGGEDLPVEEAFGWANSFPLPQPDGPGQPGEIEIWYGGHWVRFLWLVLQVMILLGVIAMAGSAAGTGERG